jgi:hypothetical protein
MAEIIRLQNELQQELTRRFQHHATLAFSDIVGSTEYFARFGERPAASGPPRRYRRQSGIPHI